MAAAHGHFAAAADLEDSAFVFAEHFDQAFDLAFDAGHFDHQRLGSEIDDAGAEDLNEVEDLRAIARRGGHLDEREFAGDVGRLGDVVDVDDVFELEEAGANAMAGFGGASQTRVRRESPARSLRPTVSELILMFRRRKSEATRVSTPGRSSTYATKVCSIKSL